MAAPVINPTDIQVADEEITMTAVAVEKVQTLLAERNLTDHGLRVFVSGGGCSGLQYGMALEGEERDFDTVLEKEGIKIFVDPTSMMYLQGATIDYVDNLMGGGFRIDNPNAVSSCGCGHSFRTDESAPAAEGESCGTTGGGCGC